MRFSFLYFCARKRGSIRALIHASKILLQLLAEIPRVFSQTVLPKPRNCSCTQFTVNVCPQSSRDESSHAGECMHLSITYNLSCPSLRPWNPYSQSLCWSSASFSPSSQVSHTILFIWRCIFIPQFCPLLLSYCNSADLCHLLSWEQPIHTVASLPPLQLVDVLTYCLHDERIASYCTIATK